MSTVRSIEDVAVELANAHRHEDPDTTEIYFADAVDEVRLVEISASVGNSGEVLPFRFAAQPSEGVPYPSTVILLSLEEWQRVKAGELSLPDSWGPLDTLKRIA